VLATAREKAKQARCASSTEQIMLALQMYAQDCDYRICYGCDYIGYTTTGLCLSWHNVLQP